MSQLFDQDLLNQQMIRQLNPSLLNKIIDIFKGQVPPALINIKSHIENSDANAIAEQAHFLKGSGLGIGAIRFSEICKVLQDAAEKGDLSNIENLVEEMETCYHETQAALEANL